MCVSVLSGRKHLFWKNKIYLYWCRDLKCAPQEDTALIYPSLVSLTNSMDTITCESTSEWRAGLPTRTEDVEKTTTDYSRKYFKYSFLNSILNSEIGRCIRQKLNYWVSAVFPALLGMNPSSFHLESDEAPPKFRSSRHINLLISIYEFDTCRKLVWIKQKFIGHSFWSFWNRAWRKRVVSR